MAKNIYEIAYDIYKNGKYYVRVAKLYASEKCDEKKRTGFRTDLREEYPESEGYTLMFVHEKAIDRLN